MSDNSINPFPKKKTKEGKLYFKTSNNIIKQKK